VAGSVGEQCRLTRTETERGGTEFPPL
jgi:hypothetical protein